MGELQLKLPKHEAMLLSCAGIETMAGRVQMLGKSESAATPMASVGIHLADAYYERYLREKKDKRLMAEEVLRSLS